MTATKRLAVWAPKTPGAQPSIVGLAWNIGDARAIAARFSDRKDLRMQDVYIRVGKFGNIIERCGPCS